MRKFKEVGMREVLQFSGLATLKSLVNMSEMNARLKINYMNAAIFMYSCRKDKVYKLYVTLINGMRHCEK